MGRKTIEVQALLEYANNCLIHHNPTWILDHKESVQYRRGMISMIEQILHSSGNYNGFRYLSAEEITRHNELSPSTDVIPGINCEKNTFEETFANTDDTRRCYF